ncbi:MAG: cation:proton antiporter, partial [Leifsonia sp.]|nr:cation:proton antiporter [Leifsonia sp.]
MLGLELVVVIGVTTLLTKVIARKTGIAQPLLLVGIGILIGLIPLFGKVELAPEVVLFLFLPAILYWESLTTSLREIKSNLRRIILMSTLLVVLTAAVVAVLA